MPDTPNGNRLNRIEAALDRLSVNVESLHASVHELYGIVQENSRQIAEHNHQLAQDAEHIRALVRIAEIHERRLSDLEGEPE
jgi:hypothetical protein